MRIKGVLRGPILRTGRRFGRVRCVIDPDSDGIGLDGRWENDIPLQTGMDSRSHVSQCV